MATSCLPPIPCPIQCTEYRKERERENTGGKRYRHNGRPSRGPPDQVLRNPAAIMPLLGSKCSALATWFKFESWGFKFEPLKVQPWVVQICAIKVQSTLVRTVHATTSAGQQHTAGKHTRARFSTLAAPKRRRRDNCKNRPTSSVGSVQLRGLVNDFWGQPYVRYTLSSRMGNDDTSRPKIPADRGKSPIGPQA